MLRESERGLFDDAGIARLPAHHLALRIQPDEGISLVFRANAVERSWEIVAPVLDASGTVHPYAAGT